MKKNRIKVRTRLHTNILKNIQNKIQSISCYLQIQLIGCTLALQLIRCNLHLQCISCFIENERVIYELCC